MFSRRKDRDSFPGLNASEGILEEAFFIRMGFSVVPGLWSHIWISLVPLATAYREPEGDWAACVIWVLNGLLVASPLNIESRSGYSKFRKAVKKIE